MLKNFKICQKSLFIVKTSLKIAEKIPFKKVQKETIHKIKIFIYHIDEITTNHYFWIEKSMIIAN